MTTVAIIDDDTEAAKTVSYAVEDAGFAAWIFADKGQTVASAVDKIRDHAEAAVCDHRLSPLGLANFDGAELAAQLILNKIPAVVISQFVSQDYDVSIRRWRETVPSVISRDECRAETIRDALELCRREINGEIVSARRKHRTLVRIADIQNEANELVIDAIVPAWNRQRAVRFPVALMSPDLQKEVRTGMYLIGYVNLAAGQPEDLFFAQFERAQPLDEERGKR